tara:strand:+ start:2624 stop:2875 length:252 start_codon:yes stop_codon:yes gene_type:complete
MSVRVKVLKKNKYMSLSQKKKKELQDLFFNTYYRTPKLTYTEEDGSTRADPRKIVDFFLWEFDKILDEKIERLEKTNITNTQH